MVSPYWEQERFTGDQIVRLEQLDLEFDLTEVYMGVF
jgi:hypothetical protein